MFMLVAIRNISVLGGYVEVATYPTWSAVRLINIGDVLTRMESLVAIDLITIGFIKVALLFYVSVLGLAQVFKMKSYLPLVPPMVVLMYILSLSSFSSAIEIPYYAYKIWPFYSIPFEIILPLLILAVAAIRNFPQREET
jgi:spore germination protein KB